MLVADDMDEARQGIWLLPIGSDDRAWCLGAKAASATSPNGLRTTTMRVPSSNDGLDPDLANDVGHAGQHVVVTEHRAARGGGIHQPGPVAGGLADRVGDQRCGLRHVQAQAAGPARAGQFGRGEDQQPIAIRRREAHGANRNSRSDSRLDTFAGPVI